MICFFTSLGLFHVVKLQNLNCLTASDYDFHDLAFKVRRKRFTIEVNTEIWFSFSQLQSQSFYGIGSFINNLHHSVSFVDLFLCLMIFF